MKNKCSFDLNEDLDDSAAPWFPPCYKCFPETENFLIQNILDDQIFEHKKDLRMRNFEDLGEIGKGSFSKIHKIKSKKSNKVYIAKLIDKKLLEEYNSVSKVQREIKVLFM